MPERIIEDFSDLPPELSDYADVNERLGEGGFAKVILAEHKPTGQKVAIKIMNKKQLQRMGDLHRAYREIEAMKRLGCHQHICQLYQVVETDEDIFLVLEYISGGELFDYIVSRERLSEKESRSLFRQIVSAVSYIHDKGLAHRDLKPENMLLDASNNIKLIDFGLTSNPETPLVQPLVTCCGSPAYAAPELVSGKTYYGTEADVWSLGVVLYGLLNGFLPFDCEEHENVSVLYDRIKAGVYEEPEWLSDGSISVLQRLLEVDAQQRITTEDLLHHPWLCEGYGSSIKWESCLQREKPDLKIIEELSDFYDSYNDRSMENLIREYKYDALTAHYYLLHKLRQKTPRPKVSFKTPVREAAVSRIQNTFVTSRRDVKSVCIDDIDITPTRKERSKSCVDGGDDAFLVDPDEKVYISPLRDTREKAASQVDNLHKMMQCLTPARHKPSIKHPKLGMAMGLVTPKFAKSIGRRVANLMTPKKVPASEQPRKIKALFKVSTTSTKPSKEVCHEIERVLSDFKRDDKISSYEALSKFVYKCKDKKSKLIFQLEICSVPGLDNILGIRHTRMKGDSWSYKKTCDAILEELKI